MVQHYAVQATTWIRTVQRVEPIACDERRYMAVLETVHRRTNYPSHIIEPPVTRPNRATGDFRNGLPVKGLLNISNADALFPNRNENDERDTGGGVLCSLLVENSRDLPTCLASIDKPAARLIPG